ncbi:hypothetical protein PENNAL_c0117G00482, partial [Penicillium nalgiovense]
AAEAVPIPADVAGGCRAQRGAGAWHEGTQTSLSRY